MLVEYRKNYSRMQKLIKANRFFSNDNISLHKC